MISTNEGYTRLEYFSEDVAADKNRKEFDIKNHTLCYTNQRPDFLFIGDSITEYWELNAYFRNSDQLIINRGIAGDTTKYLKKRFYVDAITQKTARNLQDMQRALELMLLQQFHRSISTCQSMQSLSTGMTLVRQHQTQTS